MQQNVPQMGIELRTLVKFHVNRTETRRKVGQNGSMFLTRGGSLAKENDF